MELEKNQMNVLNFQNVHLPVLINSQSEKKELYLKRTIVYINLVNGKDQLHKQIILIDNIKLFNNFNLNLTR